MTPEEAVAALDALKGRDPEGDHGDADNILLGVLNGAGLWQVVVAWEKARERCGFWYA